MPRIGTRKLYYLLKEDFNTLKIKIGRDALFTYLKSEHLLVKPKKNYTKTTNSKHWLRKYPNLLKTIVPERPEHVFVSDITYKKVERENTLFSAGNRYLQQKNWWLQTKWWYECEKCGESFKDGGKKQN